MRKVKSDAPGGDEVEVAVNGLLNPPTVSPVTENDVKLPGIVVCEAGEADS